MSLAELLDADRGENELITTSAETVPSTFPVPIPMKVRAVVFLERHAAPIGTMTTAGNFRVVEHDAPGPGSPTGHIMRQRCSDWRLFLAQDQVERPATSNMRPRSSKVGLNFG